MGSEELTTKGSQRQTFENVFLIYKAARRPRMSGFRQIIYSYSLRIVVHERISKMNNKKNEKFHFLS